MCILNVVLRYSVSVISLLCVYMFWLMNFDILVLLLTYAASYYSVCVLSTYVYVCVMYYVERESVCVCVCVSVPCLQLCVCVC